LLGCLMDVNSGGGGIMMRMRQIAPEDSDLANY